MMAAWPWHLASFVLLVVGLVVVVRHHHRRSHMAQAVRAATAVLAVAVWMAMLPHGGSALVDSPAVAPDSAVGALLMTVQAFAANLGLDDVKGWADGGGVAQIAETVYLDVLLTAAPIMSIGFVLSLFEGLTTRVMLRWWRWDEVVIFTTFDERSVSLGEELARRHAEGGGRRVAYLFTGADPNNADLLQRASALGARFVPGGVADLPRRWRKPAGALRIVCLGDDLAATVSAAERALAVDEIRTRPDADVYVIVGPEVTRLAFNVDEKTLRASVHIVDPVRAGVYQWLWAEAGRPDGNLLGAMTHDATATLRAVIFGVGTYGEQVLRALSWFGQLDNSHGTPCRLDLHGIDVDPHRESRLRADVPGLFELSSVAELPRQDAALSLTVHAGVDATTTDVDRILKAMEPVSLFWVATGDDTRNIRIAQRLRREIARGRISVAQTAAIVVVLTAGSRRSQLPAQAAGSWPAIVPFDALDTQVLAGSILDSPMEKAGRIAHLSWLTHDPERIKDPSAWADAARDFWLDLYCYRSSLATAIHGRARVAMGLSGAAKSAGDRSKFELRRLRRIEHARWSAYIRSEGFIAGPHKDTEVALTHNKLVRYAKLLPEDRAKDDNDLTTATNCLLRLREELRAADAPRSRSQIQDILDTVLPGDGKPRPELLSGGPSRSR